MSDKTRKKNLILPTSPLFASILEPQAKRMIKKLCKIKNINGHTGQCVDTTREVAWNQGMGNENLEQCQIPVGTIGMVVGIAEPKTVLRVLIVAPDQNPKDAVYHINILNLEIMNPEPNDNV